MSQHQTAAPPCVSWDLYLLFCRDVAIHQGAAVHTGHLDVGSDVPEFQAQVLPSDGDFGAPFPGTCHWDYLEGGSSDLDRYQERAIPHLLMGQGEASGFSPPPRHSPSRAHILKGAQVWDRQWQEFWAEQSVSACGIRNSVQILSFAFLFCGRREGGGK